jgi:hypothetical protein
MSNNQDRPCTCMFYFADGRRCQMPPALDDMGLCYFHAKKFRDRTNAEEAGLQISQFLNTDILTACELSSTFAALFSATAQGFIKPKTAATLAYLGQLMLQTQRFAKQEYLCAFEGGWRKVVQESNCFNPPADPDPSADPAQSTPSSSPSEPSPNPEDTSTAPTDSHPLPSRKIM